MEAGTKTVERAAPRAPAWLAGLAPLFVLGALVALFVALGAPGLERSGPPVEEVSIDRTVLNPGEIELHLRNDGPDAVEIKQAIVNDAFAAFEQDDESLGRLDESRVTVQYPWVEGEAYEVALVTATGGTVETAIDVAAETPEADTGFYGLMALIGMYVGVIPVAIGMLWLPWIRRIDPQWVQFVLALTVGLLVFLAIDATLEGIEITEGASQAFGGAALVYLGAAVSYLLLAAVSARAGSERSGTRLAFLVALGIGLHNLGEGLAIGSAYAIGSLALGASLVVGFALHNTTEGLAIVSPVAGERPRLRRFVLLGLLAGLPVVLGAWIGASAFDPSVAAFMLGLGVGAIAQVVVQLAPSIRDRAGRLLHPLAVGGLMAGLSIMYVTGLLVSI